MQLLRTSDEKKTLLKKRLKIISWAIFSPVILFVLSVIIMQSFWPSAMLKVYGMNYFLIANTKSMQPNLLTNDLVFIKKYNFDKIKTGDYVAFETTAAINGKSAKITVVHEVIEVLLSGDEKALRTKGTNPNVGVDARLLTVGGKEGTNTYIGKYSGKSRTLGWVIAFLKSPLGLTVIGLDIALFISILFIKSKAAA
jgi:signal peptidase I